MDTLLIQKGNPHTTTITFTNSDGTPYSLTGKTVLFTVKSKTDYTDDDSDALITKSITEHTSPSTGVTTLSLTAEETNIARGTYKGDLRIYAESVQVNSDTFDVKVSDIVTKRTS